MSLPALVRTRAGRIPGHRRHGTRAAAVILLLLLTVLVSSWAALSVAETPNRLPLGWPAAGVLAGLLLMTPRRLLHLVLAASLLLVLASFLGNGYDGRVSLGYSLSFVGAAWVGSARLVRGLGGRRVTLREMGDISRLLDAVTTGSLAAGIGCGLTAAATGLVDPWLVALNGLGAHAVAVLVLLPLFIESLRLEPLGSAWERAGQGAVALGTTLLVFTTSGVPPLVFAVMRMFAWPAFRGTLREAKMLLAAVALISSTCTAYGVGPIAELGARYDLAPEVVSAVLQFFLFDCGLILLPLSVVVTQQRMSAARADAERETLQRVVESATGTAIIALDRDGLITLFNPGAEAMLGYTAAEVLGTTLERYQADGGELDRQAADLGTVPMMAAVSRAAAATGEARLWHFMREDGDRRVLRLQLTRIPNEQGELSGFLATAEDVTASEAAHEAMVRTLEHQAMAVQRLEELERVKGDFVATVSHELRTPIASIIGYTEVLEDGLVGELTEAQLEVVGKVDRNGRRLLLLVEDLLTLSQVESSSLKIEPVVTDIRAVITNARAGLEPVLCSRSLQVAIDLPDTPVVHHGDPVQLERMMTNLLTNAVKFTPDGGTIAVTMRADGQQTQVVVQDSGVGISEEDQQKLFARFFRAATAFDDAIQGTGLGLTIVQAIVTLHGGKVEVSSRCGVGTTVTVTIPRVAPGVAAGRPDRIRSSATA